MERFSVVESWLGAVGFSHSNSRSTEMNYRRHFEKFCNFIGKTPDQIIADYRSKTEREFKIEYVEYIQAWISQLQKQGTYAIGSINAMITPIISFFKYKNLPSIHIPISRYRVTYHNKPIDKEEIIEILKVANIRDRAFYAVMAQSGLRPGTISKLKIDDAEGILKDKTPIPCRIIVRQSNTKGAYSSYFSFIGPEAVQYLKDYLKTRTQTSPDDWLFTKQGHENEPLSRSSISHQFNYVVDLLREKGLLEFKKGKLNEIRLYNLRKFFRKFASQAGSDFVNFWMGHSLGVDEHYFSRDPNQHRQVYSEKALPHLRIETRTPSETEKTFRTLQEKIEKLEKENLKLKNQLNSFTLDNEQMQELLRRIEKLEKMTK